MRPQLVIDLDPAIARELDAIAPNRAHRRSEFVRRALRDAIDRAIEERMKEAYRKRPDGEEPTYFEAAAWEAPPKRPARRAGSRRK